MKTETQLQLQNAIFEAGFGVVTCGNCGDVILHRTGVETIECPYCGMESDICDFPDLNY